MIFCRHLRRKSEPHYEVTPYIAEFWNTLSNLPFVIIGVLRISSFKDAPDSILMLYVLYIFCGLGSAIHHAIDNSWSIVIDWIPISLSIALNLDFGMWRYIDAVSGFKMAIALAVLAADHLWTPMKAPWGHVMWHLLAAISIDSFYYTVLYCRGNCVD